MCVHGRLHPERGVGGEGAVWAVSVHGRLHPERGVGLFMDGWGGGRRVVFGLCVFMDGYIQSAE